MKTISRTQFDSNYYLDLIEARGDTIRRMVNQLKPALNLSTALDAGCGVGFFGKILQDAGLSVRAFDGRIENVEEARSRFPQISFEQGDLENPGIRKVGVFDLVLCFGLLYHLENPLLAIRNLHALTRKALLLESMCFPEQEPWMLLREEPSFEDQSLTDIAFYASEGCLVKMLYRAGFTAVYRIALLPDHDDFRETVVRPDLVLLKEPHEAANPWDKLTSKKVRLARRVKRFLASPSKAKYASFAHRLHRWFPGAAVPVRLPFGAWWLARNDHISQPILDGQFELAESSFVQRYLKPGMTVLDIGAHHGFYSLLASLVVGPGGRVYSFEPSPRERNALLKHLRLNRRTNVQVMDFALGNENADANLYVVDGNQTGCNSLRPPVVLSGTSSAKVRVARLDDWLEQQKISHIDFVKLDVEGGEIQVLKGSERLLERKPRPVILMEVQDIRTQPWGYRSKDVVEHLNRRGFKWLAINRNGYLEPLDISAIEFDGNFVAYPQEREVDLQASVSASAPQTNGPRA